MVRNSAGETAEGGKRGIHVGAARGGGTAPYDRESPAAAEPSFGNRLTLGDLILDLDSRSVLRGEEIIALTHTEFSILELLLTHRKRIFSPDHINQSVWNDNAVGDAAIMVHIKNLRKKLGDDSRNPTYIKTAWGRGYYVD